MALLSFDGFETYGVVPTSSTPTGVHANAQGANGWIGTAITTAASYNVARPSVTADPDRRTWASSLYSTTKPPGNLINVPWNTFGKIFTTTGDSFTVGFKFIADSVSLSGGAYPQGICRIGHGLHAFDVMLGGTQNGASQGWITFGRITGGNVVLAANTSPATVTAQIGPSSFNKAVANTVEIQIVKSTGVVTIWVNNAYVGTYTNLPGTVTYPSQVHFGEWTTLNQSSQAVSPVYVTDFYAVDSGGAAPTARLGKVKVVTRVPTADVQATFTRPAGASSNAAVAGQIPPSSTNYLTGIEDGDTDLYSAPAFTFSNESIIATGIITSGYKTDASGNDVAAVLRLGGTVYEGPVVPLVTGATYASGMTIFTTNPATGLKFTKTELDAAAFGMRVKAPAV